MNEDTKLVERAAKAGFTLIEIIIAIAIVGIMAAVAVPSINKYISRARITACRQLIRRCAQRSLGQSAQVREDGPRQPLQDHERRTRHGVRHGRRPDERR